MKCLSSFDIFLTETVLKATLLVADARRLWECE